MKAFLIPIFLFVTCSTVFARQGLISRLKVSPDGHFLQYTNGQTFFWLGDTGWEMLARLDKEEIEQYLENRKEKGFNVIQTVALDDSSDPIGPNRYGELPLINGNPNTPNEKYFQLVDWTIKLAFKKGLYIALLPTWAGNVVKKMGDTAGHVQRKERLSIRALPGQKVQR